MSSSLEDDFRTCEAYSRGEHRADQAIHSIFGFLASVEYIEQIMFYLPDGHPLKIKIQNLIDNNWYSWHRAKDRR